MTIIYFIITALDFLSPQCDKFFDLLLFHLDSADAVNPVFKRPPGRQVQPGAPLAPNNPVIFTSYRIGTYWRDKYFSLNFTLKRTIALKILSVVSCFDSLHKYEVRHF